jgi:hypothetical protein
VDDICDPCGSRVGVDGWDEEADHCWTAGYIYLDKMTRIRRCVRLFVFAVPLLFILGSYLYAPPSFTSQTSHIPKYDK